MQVWLIDNQGFYQNESKFVDKVTTLMTTVPLLVGYIKPKFNGTEWTEGATEQEIAEWKQGQQIDNCSEPTDKERITELEKEKKVLKAQVEALTTQTTFLEDCLIEVGQIVYA